MDVQNMTNCGDILRQAILTKTLDPVLLDVCNTISI